MLESALAQNAYAAAAPCTGSERGLEFQLLARVTRLLRECNNSNEPTCSKLAQALFDNEKLWRTFAIDVANQDNGLPAELRSKLFYLYEFTRAHSKKVLQEDASPDALIEINTAVMKGLRGQGAAAEEEECPAG